MRRNTIRSLSRALKGTVSLETRANGANSQSRGAWLGSRPCPLSSRHVRRYSTPAPHLNESHLSMDQYHALSDVTMDSLLEKLENLLDNLGNDELEVEYHSGVLTLDLGKHGTYVINKQPPNKQIWLSSPFSGPKRYDYSDELDDWIYLRDGRALGDLLNAELSAVLGLEVNLEAGHVSSKLQ